MTDRERNGLFGGMFLIVLGLVVTAASMTPPTWLLAGLFAGPFLAVLGLVWLVLMVRDRIKRKRAEAARDAAFREGRWADAIERGFPTE